MFVLVILCILVIFYYFAPFTKKILHMRKCLRHYPGPKPVFLFGNIFDFSGDKGHLKVLLSYTKDFGSLVRGQFGFTHYGLVSSHPSFTKELLTQNKNLSKGPIYHLTKSWLGEGLLTSKGETWRNQRKLLAPAFNLNILMDFIGIFDQQSEFLVEKLKKITPLVSFDVHELLSLCTLDIICETTMGTKIDAQKNGNTDYVRCIKEMCKIIVSRTISFWKVPDFLFVFAPEYYKQRKCLKTIQTYNKKVIAARKLQRSKIRVEETSDGIDEYGRKKKFALLDALLECSENGDLSEEEIEHHVHTFMFAGHDTLTATMDFLIYELARNPNIQELAYQEQKEIFSDDFCRQVNFHDLQKMRYLDMIIKETLRLYPPVSIIAREVTEEFNFEDNPIPKGTVIMVFLFGLHRNPELFPDPETFDPCRFENPETIPQHAFIPFSTGPRNCIGHKFAMFEMKTILSKLIRNFYFTSSDPPHVLDLRAEVVLTSKNGVKVNVSQR